MITDRFDEAREILANFERRVDGLVMVQLRRIGIERRRAQYEAAKIKEEPDRSPGESAIVSGRREHGALPLCRPK